MKRTLEMIAASDDDGGPFFAGLEAAVGSAEVMRLAVFDTVSPTDVAEGKFFTAFASPNIGHRDQCNMQRAGCLATDGYYRIKRLLVGAPIEVLKSWASARAVLHVGLQPLFSMPLWGPPDPETVGIRIEQVTPMGWTFMGWELAAGGFFVSPRQPFHVLVEAPAECHPGGDLRVVLDGDTLRGV